MHGVGDAWAQRAFRCFSLPPLLSVQSQKDPDPEFPTVPFPNPEEQGALREAMLLAEEKGGAVIRFGVVLVDCFLTSVFRWAVGWLIV